MVSLVLLIGSIGHPFGPWDTSKNSLAFSSLVVKPVLKRKGPAATWARCNRQTYEVPVARDSGHLPRANIDKTVTQMFVVSKDVAAAK